MILNIILHVKWLWIIFFSVKKKSDTYIFVLSSRKKFLTHGKHESEIVLKEKWKGESIEKERLQKDVNDLVKLYGQ